MKLKKNSLLFYYPTKVISLMLHGVFGGAFGCRFYPTCTQYAYESLEKYGMVKGLAKAMWRVARCNPLSKGGTDFA